MGFTGSAVCNSFKTEVLTAIHDFTASTGDTFKLALYTNSATPTKSTTAYTTSGEVASGSGYTTAGNSLTSVTPALSTDTACCDFSDTSLDICNNHCEGSYLFIIVLLPRTMNKL